MVLAEIFLSTDGKTPEEIARRFSKKRTTCATACRRATISPTLAKRYSEGSTAQDGGDLGAFERGQLSPQLEDAVFKMDKGQSDGRNPNQDRLRNPEGGGSLSGRPAAARQSAKTKSSNKLYMEKMEPALREYLAQLREESYVMVKPGYTDSAAVAGATVIQEVAPTPDAPDKKKAKKKLPMPKVDS